MFRFLRPSSWFGPLFRVELLRLARRGSHNHLRFGLGFVLLIALFVFYSDWFPGVDPIDLLLGSDARLEQNKIARFTESFAFAVLIMQLGIVVLLTPALVAGSILEERRKGTLEFLLASELTNREIIAGKLAGRLVYILALLLMFLPILALMQFWGGVEIGMVLGGYVVILFTMLSLGGLSVHFAVRHDSLGQAILPVYLIFAGFSVGSLCLICISPFLSVISPFAYLWMIFQGWEQNLGISPMAAMPLFLGWHSLLGFASMRSAMGMIRRKVLPRERSEAWARDATAAEFREFMARDKTTAPTREGPPLAEPVDEVEISADEIEEIEEQPATTGPPEPVPALRPNVEPIVDPEPLRPAPARRMPLGNSDPLVWKEMHFPQVVNWMERTDTASGTLAILILSILSVGAVLLFGFTLLMLTAEPERIGPFYNPIVQWLGLVFLVGWAMAAALRTAASVTREREERTLETLLTLPAPRRAILAAKWKSGLARGREFQWGLLVLGLTGVITSGVFVLVVPLAVFYTFMFRWFAMTLGLWLSTVCRSTLNATVWLIVLLIALCAGPYLAAETASAVASYRGSDPTMTGNVERFISGMSPIAAWQAVTFHSHELERPNHPLLWQLLAAISSSALLLAITGGLWLDACRRFEKEGRD